MATRKSRAKKAQKTLETLDKEKKEQPPKYAKQNGLKLGSELLDAFSFDRLGSPVKPNVKSWASRLGINLK